jgi:hypothetical protein
MKARRRIFDLRAGSANPIPITDAWEGGQARGLLHGISPHLADAVEKVVVHR